MLNLPDGSESLPPQSSLSSLVSEMEAIRAELQKRQDTNRLKDYRPYNKQKEFHAAGKEHSERLFMAGNQLGKTLSGGAEWAIHLTGRYPDWWEGKEFLKPVQFWAAGVTGESTRDNPQKMLLGPPPLKSQWGTGMIPGDCIVDTTPARGTPDLLDNVVVRHGGGGDVQQGESVIWFKSYVQGREKWQGPTLDGVWFDEEPPMDIYSEGRTRTNARGIFTMITFTPLQGMSDVVHMFLGDQQSNDTPRHIDDDL